MGNCQKCFYGVDTYTLPDNLSDVATKIAYWYGSLEEKERKEGAERVKLLFSDVSISSFDGFNHAQMCLAEPDTYVKNIKKFFSEKETPEYTLNRQ